jgi:hypothetical protein
MLAIAAVALYTTLRKHGTTRQLAGVIITCVVAALLLLPALAWYNLRFNNQAAVPGTAEVLLALCYVVLCGWLLPIGISTAYCLFTLPRGSTTALHLPTMKPRSTQRPQLPHSLPGVTPPFVYEDEGPWGWLEYRNGNFSGQQLALKRIVASIGRDENCDIWLDDDVASRLHVELAWTPNGMFLTDCNSLNGTMLNGHAVRGTVPLTTDALIEIGTHRFLFKQDEHTIDPRDHDDPLAHYIWRSTEDLQTDIQQQDTAKLDDVQPHTTTKPAAIPPPLRPRLFGGPISLRRLDS